MKKRKASKKKKAVVFLGVSLLALITIAFIGLRFFRPQLASLYYKLREYTLVKQDSEFQNYHDTDGKIVIWLDPGHGGSDPGAVSDFLGEETESRINYRLCLLLQEELQQYGYTVKLSYEESTVPSENGQYPYAERYHTITADPDADLYISIHCNSYTDSSVQGSRLYYYSEASPYNPYLASAIVNGIEQIHSEDRPRLYPLSDSTSFASYKKSDLPSVLLETLFVSNEKDAEKLLNPEWLAAEAKGIAAGIHNFIG